MSTGSALEFKEETVRYYEHRYEFRMYGMPVPSATDCAPGALSVRA
jgi:hypothetical protein